MNSRSLSIVLLGLALAAVPSRAEEAPAPGSLEAVPSNTFSPILGYGSTLGTLLGAGYFHPAAQEGAGAWHLVGMSTLRGKVKFEGEYLQPFHGPFFLRARTSWSTLPLPYFGEGMATLPSDRSDLANQEIRAFGGVGLRFLGASSVSLNLLHRERRGDASKDGLVQPRLRDTALSGMLEFDFRDQAYDPRGGWYARAEGTFIPSRWRFGGPSGAVSQAEADIRGYWTAGDITFAGRMLWKGTLDGQPDFLFRPTLGGDDILRGCSTNRFIGRNLGAAQGEARWRVRQWLALVAFSDTAAVSDGALKAFRTTPGLGARFALGRGGRVKLRADIARGAGETNVTVTFGHAF